MEPVDNTWKCNCGALNSFHRTLCGKCNKEKQDVMKYNKEMKLKQEQHLIDLMKSDEELGLYDS